MYPSVRSQPSIERWAARASRWAPSINACATLLLSLASFLSLTQTAASYLGYPSPLGSASGMLIVVTCLLLSLLGRSGTTRLAFLTMAVSFVPTFVYNLFWSLTRLGLVSAMLLSVVQIATVVTVCVLRVRALFLLCHCSDRNIHPMQAKLAAITMLLYTISFLCPVPVALIVKKDTAILIEPYLMRIVRYGYLAQCLHMLQLGILALTDARRMYARRKMPIEGGRR